MSHHHQGGGNELSPLEMTSNGDGSVGRYCELGNVRRVPTGRGSFPSHALLLLRLLSLHMTQRGGTRMSQWRFMAGAAFFTAPVLLVPLLGITAIWDLGDARPLLVVSVGRSSSLLSYQHLYFPSEGP